MWKIKDDIDLKELEKYGFKKVSDFYIREYKPVQEINYCKKYYIRIRHLLNYVYYKEIQDCGKDTLGFVYQNYENIGVEDKIQDLIKANLVEKVESDE